MHSESSQQLMDKMRRQSKPRATPISSARPSNTNGLAPRSMLVVLHEMKQRRDPALVYSSAEAQARHYHDTTGLSESPLAQYLELRHAQPLWDYQREGVDFMRAREEASDDCHSGLLCDEMGMGKTRLVLTCVLEDNQRRARQSGLRFNGPSLLLCPKHLLEHWRQEAASFPQSALVVLDLDSQHHSDAAAYRYSQCDLVLATYPALADAYKQCSGEQSGPSETLRQRYKTLYGRRWRRVLADEAHQLVVETTLGSRAARDLQCDAFWPITGTPLQNRLADVRTLLHIIGYHGPTEEADMPALLERLMLRRTKEQLAQRQTLGQTPLEQAGLLRPPIVLIKLVDFAHPCERMLYYAYARYALQCRNGRGKTRQSTPVLIHWLRQLCVAPRLIKDLAAPRGMLLLRSAATAQPAVQSYMDELPIGARYTYSAGASYSERTPVSFEWDPAEHWPNEQEERHYAVLKEELQRQATVTERMCEQCDDVPLATSQTMLMALWERSLDLQAPSSKERAIMQYVLQEAPPEDKLVLFSDSVRFLQGLQQMLEARGVTCSCMHGKQSEQLNEAARDRFKRGPVRMILISLKKGNTGLNLDEANHVLYARRHWNPFSEAQATARLQRPGQRKQVRVVYFEMRGTIESYVQRVQHDKQQMLQLTGASSAADITELSAEEEAQLFDYRVSVEL